MNAANSENAAVVYVLLLQYGKYYIGFTRNLKNRLAQHEKRQGAWWTKIYKPVSLIEVFENGSFRLEKEITAKYLSLHGPERVRGAGYCRVGSEYCLLEDPELDILMNSEALICADERFFIGFEREMDALLIERYGKRCLE